MVRWLAAVGRAGVRRPWRFVLGAVVLLVVLGGAAGGVGAGFTTELDLGSTDSQRATDLLTDRYPAASGDSAQLVFHEQAQGLAAARPAAAVRSAIAVVAGQPDVSAVSDLQISADGRTGLVSVLYDKKAADLSAQTLDRLESAVAPAQEAGVEASMRGPVVDRWRDRQTPLGELVGVLAAVVLVTLLFRSLMATVVTLGAALLGLALGNTVLAIVSGFVDIPSVAPTIAIMLGLGAGIDYALFLVAKFRSRLRAGDDVAAAVVNANSSTGIAVLSAGAIVVISICGLFVTGIPLIGRMGLAAAIVVAVVATVTVVVVPALLRLVGHRVLPKGERRALTQPGVATPVTERAAREGRTARAIARAVARYPWLTAIAAAIVMLALAAPTLNLQLGQPDDSNRPAGDTMRVAYDRLSQGFGPGVNGPLLVAADLSDSPDATGAASRLATSITSTAGVAAVTPPQLNPAGDTAVISVIPTTSPQDPATSDLVDTLREQVVPQALNGTQVRAYVGGQTATFDDLTTRVSDSLPLLIIVVVLLSLVLLTLTFRSLVLPVVSAMMNLLSIGAAYGVVTLAFQTEAGAALLGVNEQPIVSFVPMLMFAILFGLSMDYNVFLLSAIREERAAGHTAREAVPLGLGRTASLISTAGAIMTLVFLGFTFTNETEVKMIGLGLATAVLVDVCIVRLFLAPALLEILGEKAWWLPAPWSRWLDRPTDLPAVSHL